jgi:hypothetical protein
MKSALIGILFRQDALQLPCWLNISQLISFKLDLCFFLLFLFLSSLSHSLSSFDIFQSSSWDCLASPIWVSYCFNPRPSDEGQSCFYSFNIGFSDNSPCSFNSYFCFAQCWWKSSDWKDKNRVVFFIDRLESALHS